MRDFWDRRARENAAFFVDNRLDYESPDMERFWAGGEEDLNAVLGAVGAAMEPTDTVVEIGCGVGRLTRVIASRAERVVALDVSGEMLEQAQEHNAELGNVTWLLGDGHSLAGVGDGEADACFSHVVFQHIPEPSVTLGYVREMGRVLRPGGWAAFQVSNDPAIHRRHQSRLKGLLRRGGPEGQEHPAWLGSSVEIEDLRAASDEGAMDVECLSGEGSQYCIVLTRRRG